MTRVDLTRRRLLRGAALGSGGVMLSGCKILDGLIAWDYPARRLMEGASELTLRRQRLLMGPGTMSKEFTRADIRQPQRPKHLMG